jgi:hypothetical protein
MTERTAAAQRTKYVLDEADLPTQWYNIQADLKTPVPPVLHPGTGQPIGPQDLAPLFPMALIAPRSQPGALDRHPRGTCATSCACGGLRLCTGAAPGTGPRYPCPHLLQIRGRQSRPAATSPTRRWPRRITTSWKG